MKHRYLLATLFVHQLVQQLEAYPLLSQKTTAASEIVDWTRFIEYTYGQECLQIVIEPKEQKPELPLMIATNTQRYVRSHMSLKFRNISSEKEGQCETFLIFAKSIEMVNNIIQFNQSFVKQFFPFTKIYFHLENYAINIEAMFSLRQFLIDNAIFGYMFEYSYSGNESNAVMIRDLLWNDVTLKRTSSHIRKELSHPLVDTNSVKDDFRISLFNCTPYTIYPEQENRDEAFVKTMDGIEFRLVQEVTKNWRKTFQFRDSFRMATNPYVSILNDLTDKSSDLAMCSLWMIEDTYKELDLSTFYMSQCGTFIVPKPIKLHEASAIYTTLEPYVWLLFLLAFLLSIVLLNNIAQLEKFLNGSESIFTDLTVTVLEAVNVATSHGVTHFPKNQISVKIVLISWILTSLWLGISYTTIYASRLASPSFEKPINTVKEMLDKELYICNPYYDIPLLKALNESIDADYRAMATRTIVYGENAEYRKRLFTERKCGVVLERLTRSYVSLLKFDDLDLLSIFRPMKHCVYNHYTSFVFAKNSPYTKLFNWHIRRYQENGITQKWNSEILQYPKQMITLFYDYPEQDTSRHRIKFINVSGAFFLLATGLSLSLIAFFVEFMKHRRGTATVNINF